MAEQKQKIKILNKCLFFSKYKHTKYQTREMGYSIKMCNYIYFYEGDICDHFSSSKVGSVNSISGEKRWRN